jgi:uncharacterized OsmC-like protein
MKPLFPVSSDLLTPFTLHCKAEDTTYARSTISVRTHSLCFDEPFIRDGTDQGPAPTESFMASLAAIANILLRRMARRDSMAIHHLTLSTDATLDRRGVWLAEAPERPWTEIRQHLTISTEADDATLTRWCTELVRFSPLHSLVAATGAPVIIQWQRQE